MAGKYPRPDWTFRPASLADFSERAKHVAWLLEMPLQATQEFLARIFGFSHLHALQADLKRANGDPTTYPPGPFVDSLALALRRHIDPDAEGPALGVRIPNGADRDSNLLEEAADFSMLGWKARTFDIREIGLFLPISEHRVAYRRVREKWLVIECDGQHNVGAAPEDYAYVTDTFGGDEAIFALTLKGRSVCDAIRHHSEEHDKARRHAGSQAEQSHAWQRHVDALADLMDAHPFNPWPKAALVLLLASNENANEEILEAAGQSIAQFQGLLQGVKKKVAPHNLISSVGEHGNETFYYPAVLYWGAMVALRLGEQRKAHRWLKQHHRIVDGDNFGSRFALAELNLLYGKGKVGSMFPADHVGSWRVLGFVATALRDGRWEKAAAAMAKAMHENCSILGFIDPSYDDLRAYAHNPPAYMGSLWSIENERPSEFFSTTWSFWRSRDDAWGFLEMVATDPEVRRLHTLLHLSQDYVSFCEKKDRRELQARLCELAATYAPDRHLPPTKLRPLYEDDVG